MENGLWINAAAAAITASDKQFFDSRVVKPCELPAKTKDQIFLFFDAYNGSDVAERLAEKMPPLIVEKKFQTPSFIDVLNFAFNEAEALVNDFTCQGAATTAVAIHENKIYFANAGHSQVLIHRDGEDPFLTRAHTPDVERRRLEEAGATVSFHLEKWRVNNSLALSRAIRGQPKIPGVIGTPEVDVFPLDGRVRFVVIASSGVWQTMSPRLVVETVNEALSVGSVAKAAQLIVDTARARRARTELHAVVIRFVDPSKLQVVDEG